MKKLYLFLFFFAGLTGMLNAQRQQFSFSPLGVVYPKYQMVQYEWYVSPLNSVLLSGSFTNAGQRFSFFTPARTKNITVVKLGLGYRRYIDLQNGWINLFVSSRVLVDYSILRLTKPATLSISSDSLRIRGFTVAPEFSFGGKITLTRHVSLSGAIGYQHLFKLFSAQNTTRNVSYWNDFYWTNDNQTWEDKRNSVINYRRGWSPTIQATLDIWLGKKEQKNK
ncbi:hypothetical protein ACO2Q8_18065 [Larkinella sp. VNQ87]|uniref:hypothetical protein n=1 Tax=Larkinella sp. VNQ87 TaxID=3400921 RepID=UPI003BFC98C1